MAYELTFTVHHSGTSQCDICNARVGYGFETTADGTPNFFHCVTCVYQTYSVSDVDTAIADRQLLMVQVEERRLREQLEEEAYRDAVMCAWIETPVRHTEDIAC